MKTFAFKNRLFLTYTAVIIAVVALFGAVLMILTTDINRRTELYHQQELFRNNRAEIETILEQMDRLASQVVSNNEILNAFIPLAMDGDDSNYFTKNLIDAIRISSLLSSINGTDNYAARISLFNGSGDYVSTGTLYETPAIIEETLRQPGFYADMEYRALSSGDERVVQGFHTDTWSNNPNLRLLSLYRPLSSFTANVYGLMDIQVGSNLFDRLTFWQADGRAEYLIVGPEGEILYPFVDIGGAQPLLLSLLETLAAQGEASVTIEGKLPAAATSDDIPLWRRVLGIEPQQERVLVMGSPLPLSDWTFVRILPERVLLAPYTGNYITTLLACLALLACLLLVINYLAIRITRPLQSLAATIGNINLQNIQQAVEETSVSYATAELNALSQAFNAMLLRLDRSVSMEIQAHMRALQLQMNPHFLYNMLSVIIESSESEGDMRTVAMCLKLSYMLRYIADYSGDNVLLTDELAHAKNYLDLMKDRYEDSFSYEIVSDDGTDRVRVPKVTVQPLAENCFAHGFKKQRPPWHIRIEVSIEEGRWQLRVIDNGSGISPEAAESIRRRVQTYRTDVAANYQSLKLGGMGLVNTLLRLSLSQREAFDYVLETVPTGGTMVCLGGKIDDTCADR